MYLRVDKDSDGRLNEAEVREVIYFDFINLEALCDLLHK